jgi:transcriptional regulator with XRE-family HTH domain
MSYKGETLTNQLRHARQSAGLSQRALSSASGLTQSHISQIERGALEPGLASLIDIARALDLELVLVPKKLLPAVDSVLGHTSPFNEASGEIGTNALAEIARGERLLKKQQILYGGSADLDRIKDSLHFLRNITLQAGDLARLRTALQMLQRVQARKQSREIVKAIADDIQRLRTRLAHSSEPVVRPAYSLEGEEEDG